MEAAARKNPLATEKIGKLIAKFALPAMIGMLISAAYNIVDQIFIGMGVGILGNAATNVAFPLVTVCTASALLVGIGTASNFNLESGKGNIDRAGRFAGAGVGLLVIFGVLIMTVALIFLKPLLHFFGATEASFPYAYDYTSITAFGIPFLVFSVGASHIIRADGRPKYAMVCVLVGAVLNTVLDPIMIFVLGWGIKGAALATSLSQAVSGLMAFGYFFKMRTVKLRLKMVLPSAWSAKRIFSLGAASCFNQIAMMAVQITMNNVLRKYGAESVYGSDIPLAVVGVISKVNIVYMAFILGISQGCQPLFGYNYGARNYARVKKTYRFAAICVLSISVVAFLCFQIFPRQITSIFGDGDAHYFEFAERYFRIFMMMTFLNGLQPVTSNFFTSIGKARKGILLSLTRQIIFLLPLILILPLFFGIDGIVYAGPIADAAACITALILIKIEFKKITQLEMQQNADVCLEIPDAVEAGEMPEVDQAE